MEYNQFLKLALFVLKIQHVSFEKREDYLQEMWFIYQQISHEKPSYIIQKFRWFILDNYRREKRDAEYIVKEEVAEWMLSIKLDSTLVWTDLAKVLNSKELDIIRLFWLGYRGRKIAKFLKITPAAVSKIRKQIQQKIELADLKLS